MAKKDINVDFGGDASGLDKTTVAATKSIKKFAADSRGALKGIGDQMFSLRGAITGLAAGFSLKSIISATIEQERVTRSLQQTIQTTGRASQISTEQVMQMAGALQSVTTFGDQAIATGQDIILTYRQIGNDIFPQVSELALDVAQKFGKAIPEAARMVGKALENPIQALGSLVEVGVTFTKQQQDQVKALVATGRVQEAQTIILGQMQVAFGGAARAARETFGGALQSAKNALSDLLEGDGANLKSATDGVNELTAALSDPEVKSAFQQTVGAVLSGLGAIARAVPATVNGIRSIAEEIAALVGGFDDLESRLNREVFRRRIERGAAAAAGFVLRAGPSSDLFGTRARLDAAIAERDQVRGARRTDSAHQMPPLASAAAPGAGAALAMTPEDAAKQAQAAASAAASIFRATLERNRAVLDAQLAGHLISYREYYAQKLALDQSAIDQEISARQKALSVAGAADRIRLNGEIEALRIQRETAAQQSAQAAETARKQLENEVEGLHQRLLSATGRSAEAQRLALEREFGELIKRLESSGDAAGLQIARQLFDVEVARTELEKVQREYERHLAAMGRAEQSLQLQIESGLITERQGRRQIVDLHQATAAEIEKLIPKMRELAAATADPDAIARVKDLEIELGRLKIVTDDIKRAIASAFTDGLSAGIEGLLNGEQTLKGALSSLFDNVLRSINKQVADDITDMITSALKGLGSSSGGNSDGFAGAMSWLASLFHQGGIAGGSAPRTRVPAIAFAGAPRYHSGGIAGLKPDEVPAVLRLGEEVLTRDDPRHRANGVSAPVTVIIQTPDAGSFRANQTELAARIGDAVRSGRRNR